jgi:enediyne biosynthesis protein CalE5
MARDLALAWDAHARDYSALFAPLTGFVAQAMVNLVGPRLPAGARLLDIACGSGALTLPALELVRRQREATGTAGSILATDWSQAMVDLTRQAATRVAAGDLVRCEVHDGEALGLDDASFDAAFSCFGIFLFGDRKAGWREAARVLRPGGTFVTSVWKGPEHNPMLRAQIEPIIEALPPEHLPQEKGWLEVADADALLAEVTTSAPFENARVYPFHASFAVPDWGVLWDFMRSNPAAGALLRRCNASELDAVRANWTAKYRQRAGGDGQPLVLESVCNILVATRRA